VEAGETLRAAVCREVWEETAWRFQPHALLGMYQYRGDNGVAYYRLCFCGAHFDHDPAQSLDHGIHAIHWLTRAELITRPLRSAMVLRCVDDYLAGIRYPLDMLTNFNLSEGEP
jgi:8-oxo-dGTP pyrophosphatase MutT (NUDIX family)